MRIRTHLTLFLSKMQKFSLKNKAKNQIKNFIWDCMIIRILLSRFLFLNQRNHLPLLCFLLKNSLMIITIPILCQQCQEFLVTKQTLSLDLYLSNRVLQWIIHYHSLYLLWIQIQNHFLELKNYLSLVILSQRALRKKMEMK